MAGIGFALLPPPGLLPRAPAHTRARNQPSNPCAGYRRGVPPGESRPIRVQDLYRVVLFGVAVVGAVLLLDTLLSIVLAVVVAILLAIPLSKCATFLQRKSHIPRVAGVLLTLLGFAVAVALLLAIILPPLVDQVASVVDQLPTAVNEAQRSLADIGIHTKNAGDAVQEFVNRFRDHPEQLLGPVTDLGFSILGSVVLFLIVIVNAVFMATNPGPLVRGLLSLFPSSEQPKVARALERIRSAWLAWLGGVIVDGIVLGFLLWVGMEIVGLEFALTFAVLSALLTVIPNYGSIISAIPPILFALQDSPGKALLVLLVYVVVNQFEGNVLYPLIMSRAVNVHPAVLAIGVVAMAALFGVIGLFISVPLLSLIVILVDELRVKPLRAREAEEEALQRAELTGEIEPPATIER
jgi:predicted PurR-regulated permease PerM